MSTWDLGDDDLSPPKLLKPCSQSAEVLRRTKQEWRLCRSIREFLEPAEFRRALQRNVQEHLTQVYGGLLDQAFRDALYRDAYRYLFTVQLGLRSYNLTGTRIIPYPCPEDLKDEIVALFPFVLNVSKEFNPFVMKQYHALLLKIFPVQETAEENNDWQLVSI
jgi:hypothetical protein